MKNLSSNPTFHRCFNQLIASTKYMADTPFFRNSLLLAFVLLKFLIQYSLINANYELHRDEFLHINQAQHLAWGYLSVPPFTSWISYLIGLLGNNIFWIKFFPALFGALTTVVVWKAIDALGGNIWALLLGASCISFSVLLRLNVLYQPNSLDVLCWTSIYYFLLQYIRSNQTKWLYILAIAFAIGFLNKYNIVFLFLGILPAIGLSSARKLLYNGHFYGALLLALLLVFPNLLWQYQHRFPVFLHLRELAETQLSHVDRWTFITSPFLFFSGSLLVLLVGLYALARQEGWRRYRLFLWSFIFTFALFVALKAKDYYAIGLYPIYFAFGATYIGRLLADSKWYYCTAVVLLPIVFFLPIYVVAFPNKTPAYIVTHQDAYRKLGLLRWEDGKEHSLPQDFADMLGWKELARKVDSVYLQLGAPEHTLVLCDNYGQAGAINYYSSRSVQAVSFNADYINWFDLEKDYKHLIRVKNSHEELEEMQQTGPLFQQSVVAAHIQNPYAREYGTVIFSFRDANVDINQRIRNELLAQPAYFNKQ